MGRRYSKNYSNYILKKKYQYTTKGTIWERDWVTIGAQHQIEKGKRPFFGDSGFLFTDNSFPSRQRRHDFGKVVAEWLYDDVKDAKALVNKVTLNYISDDLRDFAYYGSCVELVRSSIFNIINWFPGCAWVTNQQMSWKVGNTNMSGYVVKNPFNIDFATESLKEEEIVNKMRFLSLTYGNYEVVCKHGEDDLRIHPILFYDVKWRDQKDIDDDFNVKCLDVVQLAEVNLASADTNNNSFKFTFYVISAYGETVIVSKGGSGTHNFYELRPIESAIDKYFDNLEGFEKLLLRTDTTPLYANTFLKMFETDNGIRYAYRDYIWPRINDYCIDIESPTYIAFVEGLIETSTEFDDMWCDNMWRNMTHESLRNYDWTYTKTYIPGEEQPNIDGGNRLEKLIRIYGRVFDDLKRYIDGIKFTAKVSYDGYNNMPNAELSDRLEYNGWEIYSTIPNFKGQEIDGEEDDSDLSTVYIDLDGIAPHKWFYAVNPTEVTAGVNDIDFLRTLALSSKGILKSKGTISGIDMVMALFGIGSISPFNKEDLEDTNDVIYEIRERYYTTSLYDFSKNRQQAIGDLVHYDSAPSPYDEAYDGVPFGNIELYGRSYIIPYYDSDKYYKGEFTFQSRGGWYKKSLDMDNLNDYEETLSYLNVVPNFESLLTVNTYSLDKVGENANIPPSNIYYVVDPRDYANYNEVSPYNLTHYFYITDIYNPQLPDSWKPILYEYVDVEHLITQAEYDNLPYHLKKTDLDWGEFDPGDIETEQDYGALDAFYIYICNDTVIKRIEKNDYLYESNLGHVVNELCKVKDHHFFICKASFAGTDGEYWQLNETQYQNTIITPGKYIPSMFVWFENVHGDKVQYDVWKTFTMEKKAQYGLDYSQIVDATSNNIRSDVFNTIVDDKPCDFNLELLFYESRPLTQGDYVHLIDLYDSEKLYYVPITEDDGGDTVIVGYARKYEGDVELYERAKYLDSIISSNIGNNPHVGFGRYDLGHEYREYMEYPFKYYEDNYVLPQEYTESTYTLKYTVTDPELEDYVTLTEEEYNNYPFTNKDLIRFIKVTDTIDMLNVNQSGNSTSFTLRFHHTSNLVRRSIYNWTASNFLTPRRGGPQRVRTDFEVMEHPGYTDVHITVDEPEGDVVNQILTAINNGSIISYDDYMDLPTSVRSTYNIYEPSLKDALDMANRSESQDDTHDFDLRTLYEKDNQVFSDYKYDINEYEATNKVKNISDTYHYEDGYAKRISQEEFDVITDEDEKRRYERQIRELDDNGNPVYEYVKNITSAEYDELPASEQSDYNKTMAKIIVKGTYRDKEDATNDTAIDYVEEPTYPSYYLNSKLTILEFKNTNERFKKYFLDVIGKYVMQVMPSTAITVVLFDCDNKEEESEDDNG